jgi:molybdate transport system substrate-binding protein
LGKPRAFLVDSLTGVEDFREGLKETRNVTLDRWRRWLLLLALWPIGCGPGEPELPKLHVAAASDLQSAMPILASAFRQTHDIEVIPTLGASGQLAEQIRQGAPFDVFLSANRMFVDRLAAEGHVKSESVQPYARGSLVLAVNKLSAIKIESMSDLKKAEVHKIAIANVETAPYGMAAKQALERAKLWDLLQPKIVPAESVGQALQMVQTGNAEVAFVGRSIAEVREAVIVSLPTDVCDPIIQYLGIVTKTSHPEDARAFTEFVLGDVGQGILFELGFRGVKKPAKAENGKNAGAKVVVRP